MKGSSRGGLDEWRFDFWGFGGEERLGLKGRNRQSLLGFDSTNFFSSFFFKKFEFFF